MLRIMYFLMRPRQMPCLSISPSGSLTSKRCPKEICVRVTGFLPNFSNVGDCCIAPQDTNGTKASPNETAGHTRRKMKTKRFFNEPEKPTLNYSVVYHSSLLQSKRPCYDFTFNA